jgi:hypothetical protein
VYSSADPDGVPFAGPHASHQVTDPDAGPGGLRAPTFDAGDRQLDAMLGQRAELGVAQAAGAGRAGQLQPPGRSGHLRRHPGGRRRPIDRQTLRADVGTAWCEQGQSAQRIDRLTGRPQDDSPRDGGHRGQEAAPGAAVRIGAVALRRHGPVGQRRGQGPPDDRELHRDMDGESADRHLVVAEDHSAGRRTTAVEELLDGASAARLGEVPVDLWCMGRGQAGIGDRCGEADEPLLGVG